jgi:hypothetical protein
LQNKQGRVQGGWSPKGEALGPEEWAETQLAPGERQAKRRKAGAKLQSSEAAHWGTERSERVKGRLKMKLRTRATGANKSRS